MKNKIPVNRIKIISASLAAVLLTTCVKPDLPEDPFAEPPSDGELTTRSSPSWRDAWVYTNFRRLGSSSFFIDGYGNVLYDHDGDGVPDSVWIPTVTMTPGQGAITPETVPNWNGGNWQGSGAPYFNQVGMVVVPPAPPEWYGGGGGGAVVIPRGPGDVAPNASKIFHNPNMPTAEWAKIEKMAIQMMNYCMGYQLAISLYSELGGKKLLIDYDPTSPTSNFNLTLSKITLRDLDNAYTFMHEIFHAFQAYGESLETMIRASANLEAEAQLAKVIFMTRSYSDINYSKNMQELVSGSYTQVLYRMAMNLDSKGQLIDANKLGQLSQDFYSIIQSAVQYGESHKRNGENPYRFDSSRTSFGSNMKNIIDLSRYCL